MKNLAKSLVVAGAMAVAGTASADWFDCFNPVIGIDYYQVWMKAKNNFGTFAPKSYPGGTIYVGAKFADCLGFEVGYDTSTNKSKSWTVTDPGNGRVISGTTKIRRTGGHIDLIGYMPLDCFDCVELFGTIGYGWVQPKITVTTNVAPINSNLASALVAASGKGRSVLRLGLGINYLFTECMGVRAKIGYESTSSLRFNNNTNVIIANQGLNTKPFRGSATLALGAFVRF